MLMTVPNVTHLYSPIRFIVFEWWLTCKDHQCRPRNGHNSSVRLGMHGGEYDVRKVPAMRRRCPHTIQVRSARYVQEMGETFSPAVCYQALQSRDSRFDGRFFTAVLTTGIYCRPVCPARTPRIENVEFYWCAAAAERAGFRPCLRCRPEAAPGTPAWQGTSTTVVRALRMMEQGALEQVGVEHFAQRLGVTARHLRRLFHQHLGVSPLALARTRRLHLALRLLRESSLPISQVALAAGFSSLRHFNGAFRKAYGATPTRLRRAGTSLESAPKLHLHLKLSYRTPYDFESLLRFLGERCIPGVESVDGESYSRTICVAGEAAVIRVSRDSELDGLCLRVPVNVVPSLNEIVRRVRRLLDVDADPAPIRQHLERDPRLAPLLDFWPGLRVAGAWSGFEVAVRAILGQQVSVRAASTLAGRVVRRFGTLMDSRAPAAMDSQGLEQPCYLFPTAQCLAAADLSDLGLPARRGVTIQRLAREISQGRLDLTISDGLDNLVSRLETIPGIGPWTAHYIGMRAVGETDAFPCGDLILRRRMHASPSGTLSASELDRRAESWRPWRAYAAMYLWRDDASSTH